MTVKEKKHTPRRKRAKQIHVPVTGDEDRQISAIAEKVGKSKAAVLRDATLGLEIVPRIDVEQVREVTKVGSLLGSIGGEFKLFLMVNKGLQGTIYYEMIEDQMKKFDDARELLVSKVKALIRSK